MSLFDREIKFRVWIKVSQRFATWEDICHKKNFHRLIDNPDYILMQYTGLKDKKGVEIYEGDIIDYDGEIANVTYENIMVSFCVGGNSFDNSETKYMKVIGNIYENQELLKA